MADQALPLLDHLLKAGVDRDVVSPFHVAQSMARLATELEAW